MSPAAQAAQGVLTTSITEIVFPDSRVAQQFKEKVEALKRSEERRVGKECRL